MTAKVILLSAREARLKRSVRQHLQKLGFLRAPDGRLNPPSLDKEAYRKFHEIQRLEKLKDNSRWLGSKAAKLHRHFASGFDVDPASISPILHLVTSGTWQSDLFRLAALNWRVPVSNGYGRRMRFLVLDQSNQKLIGLMALGDAVFNQKARDEHIGWDHHQRSQSLVNLMDAYVLGAVPPYSMLLGGKLVASLLRTKDIVAAFTGKYAASVGIISGEEKRAKLAAVTTSSALGRSSVYNRLKLDGTKILAPIGYTSGWGHFHFSGDIFDDLRQYLEEIGDPYAQGFEFGSGSNWKIRVIRRALERLGMDTRLTQHGFQREVFICEMAHNSISFLQGKSKTLRYGNLPSVGDVSELAKNRWIIPRAERDATFRAWSSQEFVDSLTASPVMSARAGRTNVLGA